MSCSLLAMMTTITTTMMIATIPPVESWKVLLPEPPAPASLLTVPPELAVPALSPQSLVQGCSVANGKADDVEDAIVYIFPAALNLRTEGGLFWGLDGCRWCVVNVWSQRG